MAVMQLEEDSLEPVMDAFGKFKDYLSDPQVWGSWLVTVIQIALALIIGRLCNRIVQRALTHMMNERRRSPLKLDQRRTQTIGRLLNNIAAYTINFVLILIILGQFGINLAPVLAGAGVLGLAIGFGAQSLVKDVITGFFIIFEDQFGVGDVVQTGAFKGTVEEIGLRVTRIRSEAGEVHIIPNGTIQQVTNYSLHNSVATIDVPVSNEADIRKMMEVLDRTFADAAGNIPNLVGKPEILGLQALGGAESSIRITAECRPNTQDTIERELKLMLKETMDTIRQNPAALGEA